MREFGAMFVALVCAAMGFFVVAIVGCIIAVTLESIVVAWITVALGLAAAGYGGYLGAKMVLNEFDKKIYRSASEKRVAPRQKPDDSDGNAHD